MLTNVCIFFIIAYFIIAYLLFHVFLQYSVKMRNIRNVNYINDGNDTTFVKNTDETMRHFSSSVSYSLSDSSSGHLAVCVCVCVHSVNMALKRHYEI